MDLDAIKKDIGLVDEPEVKVEEAKGKPARVKEISVSLRVSPQGTYSSAEFSQTVEVNTTDPQTVRGITKQLKKEVTENAIDSAKTLVIRAKEEGML